MNQAVTSSDTEEDPLHIYAGLSTTGTDAARILGDYGWHLLSEASNFFFAGDFLACDDFTVSKYSHPAAEFRFGANHAQGDSSRTMHLICLEGTFTLHTDYSSLRINPGEMIRVRRSSARRASNAAPVTMLLITHSEAFDPMPGRTSCGRADPQSLRFLLALAEAVVMNHNPMLRSSYRALEHAFADLCRILIESSQLMYEEEPSARLLQLRNSAIAVISEHAHDPDFDVNRLARMLSVSRTHLFRAFQSVGQAPGRAILNARLGAALRLQTLGYSEREAAERSGFGTVRKLRYATRSAERAVRSVEQGRSGDTTDH